MKIVDADTLGLDKSEVVAVKWALLRDLRARMGTTQLTEAEITQFAFSRLSLMALRGAVDDAIDAIQAEVRGSAASKSPLAGVGENDG